MTALRLVIFDVDGTLVDSAGHIVAAMEIAYGGLGLAAPSRAEVRAIVGLSLEAAFARLSPGLAERDRQALLDGYRGAYAGLRRTRGSAASSPLFAGARAALDRLNADPFTLLAVATGKSRRGLDALIEGHGLEEIFVSRQTADTHPSKPDPSMIRTILAETGADPARTVMVGDTTFDMDMARAAGVRSIGVAWGYHPPGMLRADRLIDRFDDLDAALTDLMEAT